MRRRIRKAEIKFVSLVPKGANRLAPVYKADGSFEMGCLSKAAESFDESGELLNVVYAPDMRDSQGDIADAAVVKEMAYGFIPNGAGVDINHDGKPVAREKAHIAENFLIQKSDERFHGWKDDDGKAVDLTGGWATVIKINDPDLRKKYRSGEWAGVSMGGTALVEAEKSAPTPPTPTPTPEQAMTPEELKALQKAISDGFSTLTADLTKALKPVEPPAPQTPPAPPVPPTPKADEAPVFKGDTSNSRALQMHERALEAFELKKSADFADPASVREYRAALQELQKAWKDEDEADGITVEQPLVKGRRVAPTVTAPVAKGGVETIADLQKAALEAANSINTARGFAAVK